MKEDIFNGKKIVKKTSLFLQFLLHYISWSDHWFQYLNFMQIALINTNCVLKVKLQ